MSEKRIRKKADALFCAESGENRAFRRRKSMIYFTKPVAKIEELEQQNAALQKQLDDRTLRLEHAGSIAEASLALHQVFEAAQAAADAYLESVKAMNPPLPSEPPQSADNGGADAE